MSEQGTLSEGTGVIEETGAALVPADDSALAVPDEHDDMPGTAGAHRHPGPKQYVIIAIVLVVITGIEVALSYLDGDVNSALLIGLLGFAAAIKFFLVAAWYMHMRMDAPFFRRVFVIGLVGATVVYGIALFTFASTVLSN